MNTYHDVLLEEIRDEIKAVHKLVGGMQQHVQHIPTLQANISSLKDDMFVVKAGVKDISRIISQHEQRINTIENL